MSGSSDANCAKQVNDDDDDDDAKALFPQRMMISFFWSWSGCATMVVCIGHGEVCDEVFIALYSTFRVFKYRWHTFGM